MLPSVNCSFPAPFPRVVSLIWDNLLKLQLTCKTFGIDVNIISEGNWTNEHIYFNAPGLVLSRMKMPSEEGVKQQRRLEKILPVFALKAVMQIKLICFQKEPWRKTTAGKNVQNVELELSDFILSNVKPNKKVYFSPFFFFFWQLLPQASYGVEMGNK